MLGDSTGSPCFSVGGAKLFLPRRVPPDRHNLRFFVVKNSQFWATFGDSITERHSRKASETSEYCTKAQNLFMVHVQLFVLPICEISPQKWYVSCDLEALKLCAKKIVDTRYWTEFDARNVIRRAVTWTSWICRNICILTKKGGLGGKNREISGNFWAVTVLCFPTDFDGKGCFWASKIKVFNLSGDGFLKTKNLRHIQVKKNGDIFRIFHKSIETFYR